MSEQVADCNGMTRRGNLGTVQFKGDVYPYYLESDVGIVRILFWVPSEGKGDQDRFLRTNSGTVAVARDSEDVEGLFGGGKVRIHWNDHGNLNVNQFFRLMNSLREGRATRTESCLYLLDGWNFLEDVLYTLGVPDKEMPSRSGVLAKSYQKLFRGANLPSMTRPGRRFHPTWLADEITHLRQAMQSRWDYVRVTAPEVFGKSTRED